LPADDGVKSAGTGGEFPDKYTLMADTYYDSPGNLADLNSGSLVRGFFFLSKLHQGVNKETTCT
jgi:hypothetical protein